MLFANLRRYVGLALLAVAVACTQIDTAGPDAQGYKWRRDGPVVPRDKWAYHTVGNGNIYLHCNLEAAAESCAVVRADGSACDIYLPPDAPAWRIAHEEKHCDGWTHPGSSLKKSQLAR